MRGIEKCTANTENTSKYETLKVTQYNRRLKTEEHLVNVGVVSEYPLLAHSPTSLTSSQHMLLVPPPHTHTQKTKKI